MKPTLVCCNVLVTHPQQVCSSRGARGMLLFYRDDKADKEEKLDLLPLRIIACLPFRTMEPNYFQN